MLKHDAPKPRVLVGFFPSRYAALAPVALQREYRLFSHRRAAGFGVSLICFLVTLSATSARLDQPVDAFVLWLDPLVDPIITIRWGISAVTGRIFTG